MKTFSIFATHFTINRDPFFYVNHVSKAAGRWLFHYCFIDCLWSEAISFVRCFVNLEMMVVLLPLELHLLWTSRVLTIILWFLKMLSYPYLGPSHFRYPQYKEKVSHLKNKKKLVVLGISWYPNIFSIATKMHIGFNKSLDGTCSTCSV